jgi:hypothetical protein
VHVLELTAAERGDRCGCTCPICATPLRAYLGTEKQRAHFRHRPSGGYTREQCSGAAETMLHKIAKQVVVDALAMHLPDAVARLGGREIRVWRASRATFAHAVAERGRWVPMPRPRAQTEMLGLPLRAEAEARFQADVEAKRAFDRGVAAELEGRVAKVVGQERAPSWIAERLPRDGRPIMPGDRDGVAAEIAALEAEAASHDWRRRALEALREAAVAKLGRDAGDCWYEEHARPALSAPSLDEETQARLHRSVGMAVSFLPESAHAKRLEGVLSSCRKRLEDMIGAENAADYHAEFLAQIIGPETLPSEMDAACAALEGHLAKLGNAHAALRRLANRMRDTFEDRASRVLGRAADDWRAEHLDPAYENVASGRVSRRKAAAALEASLDATTVGG